MVYVAKRDIYTKKVLPLLYQPKENHIKIRGHYNNVIVTAKQ